MKHYADVVSAMSQLTFQLVYIWNISEHRYLFLEGNSMVTGDLPLQKMKEMPLNELLATLPPPDQERINTFVHYILSERKERSPAWIRNVIYHINFKTCNGRSGKYINHKLKWLDAADNEKPHLLIGIGKNSVHRNEEDFYLEINRKENSYRRFEFSSRTWDEMPIQTLNENEREMLQLSSQGLTANRVAKMICKSIDTISYYRASVFQKLNVRNISEAITFAMHYGMI